MCCASNKGTPESSFHVLAAYLQAPTAASSCEGGGRSLTLTERTLQQTATLLLQSEAQPVCRRSTCGLGAGVLKLSQVQGAGRLGQDAPLWWACVGGFTPQPTT
jgi:hypothetical protein